MEEPLADGLGLANVLGEVEDLDSKGWGDALELPKNVDGVVPAPIVDETDPQVLLSAQGA